jgi:ribosomal protein S17E
MAKSTSKHQKKSHTNWKQLFFELIVVFLGVTAGFLLNNWQLAQQDQKLEQKYLNSFLEDVNSNITELEKSVDVDSLWLERVMPQLILLRDNSFEPDSAASLIKGIVQISRAGIQKGTYQAITNSGNLNIITNYALKKQIVDYHQAINSVEFIDDYFYQYFNDFVMPFVFTNFSVLKEKLTNPIVIKTVEFENVIAGYASMVQQRKDAYQDLLEKSYELKTELEK